MLKKILTVIVAIIAVFAAVAAMQPDDFRVERSVTIAAPASAIFEHVNDLRKWEAWSPWAKVDPNAKSEFEGPQAGAGAIMRWEGNYEVGKGSMAIAKSTPYEFIQFDMEFQEPMQGFSTAEFSFKPEDDASVVTWSMYGKNDFLGKAMGLIFNCEKMVGGRFEEGLANLKGIVEGKPAAAQ